MLPSMQLPSTSPVSELPDDTAGSVNVVRIVVPRILRPVPRAAHAPIVYARLLAVATEHLRLVGLNRFTLRAVADELDMARASEACRKRSPAEIIFSEQGFAVPAHRLLTRFSEANEAF